MHSKIPLSLTKYYGPLILSRNEPVQPHGSPQCPDLSGTNGSPSCFAYEPPTANEPECRPSSKDERKKTNALYSTVKLLHCTCSPLLCYNLIRVKWQQRRPLMAMVYPSYSVIENILFFSSRWACPHPGCPKPRA